MLRVIIYCLLALGISTGAQAATVTFDGNIYTIGLAPGLPQFDFIGPNYTSINGLGGEYEDNVLRNQPWADSNETALLFMSTVGTDLGLNDGSTFDFGPFFVTYETGLNAAVYRSDGSSGVGAISRTSTGTFAVVTDVAAVPLPAAAWLFAVWFGPARAGSTEAQKSPA